MRSTNGGRQPEYNHMKTTHLLAGLMALAAIVVDLVLASRLTTHPNVAFMLLWGLACGQLTLLVVWSVWGQTAWLIRWLSVVAAAAWVGWPLAEATNGRWTEWFALMCLFVLCVSVPCHVARVRGWTVHSLDLRPFTDQPAPMRRVQFSLADLLSLVTLSALILGLRSSVAFPWRHLGEVVCYGACLTVVAGGAVWAIASRNDTWWRLGVVSSICVVAGWAMFAATSVRDAWFFTTVAFSEAIVICLGLSIMQMAGVWLEIRNPAARCRHRPIPAPPA